MLRDPDAVAHLTAWLMALHNGTAFGLPHRLAMLALGLLPAALGGLGGVSLLSQVIGSGLGMLVALVGGFGVYGLLKHSMGIRLSQEEEFNGADLSIHRIGALSHD